jgi:hypothetical protein
MQFFMGTHLDVLFFRYDEWVRKERIVSRVGPLVEPPSDIGKKTIKARSQSPKTIFIKVQSDHTFNHFFFLFRDVLNFCSAYGHFDFTTKVKSSFVIF